MLARRDEIRALGGEVIVLSFGPPERLAWLMSHLGFACPAFSDPSLGIYRALGLGSASRARVFAPGVVWAYLKLLWRGRTLQPRRDADVYQLGGDMVVDASGRMAWLYRQDGPDDRPSAATVVEAFRGAVQETGAAR